MSINQSTSLLLHFGLMALSALLISALIFRIALGTLSVLASPIYLLLHYSFIYHKKEFAIKNKGWKRLLSDFCGTMVFLIICETGWVVFQTASTKTINPITILQHLQANVSNAEVLITLIMFATVCLLSWPKKTNGEAGNQEPDNWLDKMRNIKFPPPFDWL